MNQNPIFEARSCDLCLNPYPYMCSECNMIEDKESEAKRSLVGSEVPEDFWYV